MLNRWNDRLVVRLRLLLVLLTPATHVLADPFTSALMPRSAAMAGAFTAVADDATAVWYNPAGLIGLPRNSGSVEVIDFDFSTSAATQMDVNSNISSSGSALFVGVRYSTESRAFGFYYFEPYSVDYRQASVDGVSAWGAVKESIKVLSVPMAAAYFDGRVKVGGTLELVSVYANDSVVNVRDDSGWVSEYQLPQTEASSYSGSISTLVSLYESTLSDTLVNIGVNYRFKAHRDANLMMPNKSVDLILVDKPDSFDLGISYQKRFIDDSRVIVSSQFGRTEWEENQIYTRTALGAEYQFSSPVVTHLLQPMRFSLQMGYSNSTADIENSGLNRPDLSVATLGVEIRFDRQLKVSTAIENKTASSQNGAKSSETFFSLGFGYRW